MSSSFQKNKLPPYFSPSLDSPYLKSDSNVTTREKKTCKPTNDHDLSSHKTCSAVV